MTEEGELIHMDDELRQLREKRLQEMMKAMETKKKPDVIVVNGSNFSEILKENRFVLLDFWAEWCGPCRTISPIVEELASEFRGRVAFGKCNTDENPQIAGQFGISAIPTLLLFANGRLVDRVIGAYPKEMIRARIMSNFRLKG
ncbi:MAG: thioredoxin [Methanomicrobiales archaeon]|nr:thioredoxin [Methanomicrobiales archaeon]